MVLISYCDN